MVGETPASQTIAAANPQRSKFQYDPHRAFG
jgi:hypothetical protein